ncbi:unnamed protein product [Rotaria magnacalcarata]|uniref:Uncharacterized protein n=1 Tax=Rotaria magnacalcarata TaxID=392030 RepID=A0A816S1B3_9BILA|nr:unnamed protein product [Rotaria magnacalcarata]CAF1315758.1 unnamed protein product [Rotaria magnacalcarata]CAF2080661.1 unnamed protein product [Rotaria magnacalcarata]CAF4365801.1 unnamed protein product [Rotaria magnacalcarata]CAF4710252.1 unnamed protein product [Rotaria magnacalcarata]
MANICPLLIRPSFSGNTYHDFQLNFESPTTNCTTDSDQSILLIQFTRILSSTSNDTSYALYDLAKKNNELPYIQVFPDDHINLCIRSAFHADRNEVTCYEFYMITMLSSIDRTFWPLLIIFGYIIILIIPMFFSLLAQIFNKLSRTFHRGSITKKLVKTRNIFPFLPTSQRHLNDMQLKKLDGKKEFLNAIDFIAKECQKKSKTFIITPEKSVGQFNRAYL